ncbi:MAG: antibiotic biosynthesis monooxygenase [Chloroflexi bacterium]|nr:MAG: antibiotic biosynthesis monooxygenase [Chloroflexota bacterium]
MLVNLVFVEVKPDKREEFRFATFANAAESRKESGIARFDVLEEKAEPFRFVLIEVFRDTEAEKKHKETAHYKKWRETVEPMMADDRKSVSCLSIDPPDPEW